jgi:type II secretory ATPase GspE/PulE/Tfp pilus assembly ATPase PilB-like protein
MGMNPLHFSDALLLVIAQRLVHTLCKKCKEDYHPTQEEFDLLVEEYGTEAFSSLGIKYKDSLMLKRPVGCKKCEETGLAGRTGLYEILEGTPELKSLVMKGATVGELRKQAISDGMTTLKQDGIQKVFKGECDLKHVNAVCLL